ncbi:MAG: molybdopterin molybdotransferase MoeA [Firmicutes bacterium]|nr:molybdopterin molybdotransferase MoeA [Bacillota bacterium]
MKKSIGFVEARQILMDVVTPVGTEKISLSSSFGRILAQSLTAQENIPPFDRSPYDGYALRAEDTALASENSPVTLQVLEEIPAGAIPTRVITEGTAAKILTGAPIPAGANTVVMYEKTSFTETSVTVFSPLKAGDNIVCAGEDVRQGQVLAQCGQRIDAGLAGTLAAQGVGAPVVYRKPRIALLSTGSELVEAEQDPAPGKIRNSNRYMLEAALTALGCECVYLGIAGDSAEEICTLIRIGLANCDAVLSTGGVSAGDYDLTPDAMILAGVDRFLIHGVDLKPGMACTYGMSNGKLICALSGNPASSITNFYAIAMPVLRKMAGHKDPLPQEIEVTLLDPFRKKSKGTRLLRGELVLQDGKACMRVPSDQGNVVLSSTIGCNVMAIVPAGSDKLPEGTVLKGFLL